jgi:hypothetical protein
MLKVEICTENAQLLKQKLIALSVRLQGAKGRQLVDSSKLCILNFVV